MKIRQVFLDILFPPICLNCRAYLQTLEEKENLLCHPCFSGISIYSNIFRPELQFKLAAIGSYGTSALRELLHYFKYNGFLAARIPLEKLIVRWSKTNPNLIPSILAPSSCVVPIPLHKNRLRKRGFNQAEIISEILGRHLNLPVEKNLLERIRETKSQIKMGSVKEREANVKASIQVREGEKATLSRYGSIILVDDIYTSGSTMREAAKALRQGLRLSSAECPGIKNITAFVIAKT